MKKLFMKWKLWYCHFQLQSAVDEHARLQEQANNILRNVIPELERQAYRAEFDLRVEEVITR